MSVRVAGLILAAGHSRRMGTPKALLHIGGPRIIDRLVDAYLGAKLDPLVVVASPPVCEALRGTPRVILVPGDADAPMIDSVARGFTAFPDDVAGAVVQPVDAPFTDPSLIAELLMGGPSRCRVPCHHGQAGHPIYLPRVAFLAVHERPEGGLRAILSHLEVEVVEWPEEAILADLDTPEDLARWHPSGRLH